MPRYQQYHPQHNPVLEKFSNLIAIDYAIILLHYGRQTAIQSLIANLKYRNRPGIGITLGHWYAQHLMELNLHKKYDLIIPIPLHPAKERRRGYNQSLKISEGIAQVTDIQIAAEVLYRKADTRTQTKKHKVDRWSSMQSMFEINNPEFIKGKHVLLMDDVITTGATMESAASIIQNAKPATLSIGGIASGSA